MAKTRSTPITTITNGRANDTDAHTYTATTPPFHYGIIPEDAAVRFGEQDNLQNCYQRLIDKNKRLGEVLSDI